MKSVLYNNQRKIIVHKIDIRFVVNDSGEYDVDAAKLLVEAKDVVDLMVNNTIHVDDIGDLSGTGFQIGGKSVFFSIYTMGENVSLGIIWCCNFVTSYGINYQSTLN
ncbi:hypothetical protein [Parasitella parasitica]|uniref:Uncharacterized protein n=1 Tax=Parasitella parasitica TaxID=35722 RepID=A0A0B7N4B5_9FUNG|nr:hypothetical protein [Parasitella parasitica]